MSFKDEQITQLAASGWSHCDSVAAALANDHWTFSLFAGEKLIDGCAESGTVLKGRVRFRLGKSSREIGSARIAPAIAIP